MKLGVEVRIDVTKIDKARIYNGAKGKYLTMTTFIDTEQKDEYENNGFISHKKEKDEQGNTPILGSVKVFWVDNGQQQGYQQPQQQRPAQHQATKPQQAPADDFEDDIPFNQEDA